MRRSARRALLLLAAVLLLAGVAPAATGAGVAGRSPVAGAGHAAPDDLRLYSALVAPQVDRGTSPERPAALALVPVAVSRSGSAPVGIAGGRDGDGSCHRFGSDAWGRAPPVGERSSVPS